MTKETKRRKARQFLREFAHRDDWLVLDTETTGPDRGSDEPVEIAVLKADGTVVFDTLVEPVCEINEEAQNVHGISPEDVKGEPTMADLPLLAEVLRNETVLIYNRGFDGPILRNGFVRRGAEVDRSEWDLRCVMKAYAMAFGTWSVKHGSYSWVKLEEACNERGIDTSDVQLHRAKGDTELTRRLVRSCTDIETNIQTV